MRRRGALVAAVLGGSLLSGGVLLARGLIANQPNVASTSRLFDVVASDVERYYVDSLSDSTIFDKAAVGMLQELGDPYTLYLPPDRVRRLTESTTGNYVGIGAQVQRRDSWPMVVAPFPGSPSERAGLHTGDRIVAINGRSTRGWTADETLRALRGPPETEVKVTIERPGTRQRQAVTLTRSGIHRPSVARVVMMQDGIGYIDINTFSDSTARELAESVDSLRARGLRTLILDLRGNPGGVLTQGVRVADLFLSKGEPIVSMRGRTPDTDQKFVAVSAERWPDMPLLVLIDESSASAAEIVAGALQDHDRAVVVGRQSFGKGSAQSVFALDNGAAVKLTTARWYMPSGRSIDRPRNRTTDVTEEPATRKQFRTEHGRIVYGGGGVTPDLTVGDTALAPAEQALDGALGTRVIAFRDALTAYAIQLKTGGAITSRDFTVTPAMLDGLWSTMRARGFDFSRHIYDGAAPTVSRLLAREIAHYVFGTQAEAERWVADDETVTAARRLAEGVTTTAQLLDRAHRESQAGQMSAARPD